MASVVECKIELKTPPWREYARKLEETLPGLLAATLQTQRAMVFDSEGSYNGRPGWKPLKCRRGQILKDRGTLSQSIGPRNDGLKPGYAAGSIVRLGKEVVTIGTNIKYASVQNNGATIRPVKAKALRFKCHGEFVFRKKVTIPARPFNDFTPQDISEITETLETYIASVIGGGP